MRYPNPRFGTAILLNATNYTLVELVDSSSNPINCETVLFQCRTAVDVLFSNDPTPGQAYGTLKAGTSLPYQIEGGSLGPIRSANMVTNGTFTGDSTGWTVATDQWTYGANAMAKDADGTGTITQATCAAVVDSIYEVVHTISSWSVGTVTPSMGGVNGVARGADGTFKEYMKATATTAITFTPSNTSRFTEDDIACYKLTGNLLFAKASAGTPYLEIFYLK